MAAMSTGIPIRRLIKRNLYEKEWNRIGEWWADRFEGGTGHSKNYDLSTEILISFIIPLLVTVN